MAIKGYWDNIPGTIFLPGSNRAADRFVRASYSFENVLTPNVLWIDLKNVDFSSKANVLKLSLDKGQVYAGDALAFFKEAVPFEFQGL